MRSDPYRHSPYADEEWFWGQLDEAILLWHLDPVSSARIATWIWQDARWLGLRDVEAAADGFLTSLAARSWF